MSETRLPDVAMGSRIPPLLHTIYFAPAMPDDHRAAREALVARNPGWTHELYDEAGGREFILGNYGPEMLARFDAIDPAYYSARADLLRYLIVYMRGGVYLDAKSDALRPFAEVLRDDDRFIISQWDPNSGDETAFYCNSLDLARIPGGEFQQWFLISVPGHPFLRATIDRVCRKIDGHRVFLTGIGMGGVLRTTGPVPYTLAIHPLLKAHPHRRVHARKDMGLVYMKTTPEAYRQGMQEPHYSKIRSPVVKPRSALDRLSYQAFRIMFPLSRSSIRFMRRHLRF